MLNRPRIWEIDFLRGVAIVLMVAFHVVYDLVEFYNFDLDYLNGFWHFAGRSAAVLFITLSGVSSNLSANIFKQCVRVLFAALAITAATYFIFPNTYVRFGILHLLACCLAISIFFHKMKNHKIIIFAAAIFGTAAFGAVPFIAGASSVKSHFSAFFLLPLGITWQGFGSIDYYPLIPWSGFFFCGLAFGKLFYKDRQSLFKEASPRACLPLCFLGRHSLLIYLIHQPLIMALLTVFNQANFTLQ